MFTIISVLQAIGAFVLFKAFYIIDFLITFSLRRRSTLEKYRHFGQKGEPWALVTGASDGIGLAFSEELCRRDFNVVLHGRCGAKLAQVQRSLLRQYPSRSTRLLVLPALTATPKEIEEAVSTPDITSLNLVILVNNIGGLGDFVTPKYMPLWSYTASQVDGVLNLNARFATHLLRLLVPRLASSSPGLILNVSSVVSFGSPYIAIYTGTKAYIDALSRSLAAELSSEEGYQRVDVMSLALGNTKSVGNFHTELTNPILYGLCDTGTAARTAFDRVGSRKVVVSGWWMHELQRRMFNLLPERRRMTTMVRLMKKLKGKDFTRKESGGSEHD